MPHPRLPRPVLIVLAAAAAVVALAAAGPASASLVKAGPINPQTGFPAWYEDANGLRLEPCVTSVANCFLGGTVPDPAQPFSVPANAPEEFFYYDVDSEMTSANGGTALLRVGLEGAFSSATGLPEAGKQAVFARVRVRVDNLVANAEYTVTHPWGVEKIVAGPSARRSINFTSDIGCPVAPGSPPCDFSSPLTGAVGPFFGWDVGAPAGFLGTFGVPHVITTPALTPNVFRIEGPDVGGPGVNLIETNQFQVSAKVAGALIATPASFGQQRVGTTSAPQTITITNTSPLSVPVGAAAVAGTSAADFAVTADSCSNTTLAVGGACTVGLTFAPGASGDRLASLGFAGDDMRVLLSGTGAAPVLSFGTGVTSVPFGSLRVGTTLSDPVVITNTGLAPMNVTGASIVGANAGEFAISANGCIGLAIPAGANCTIAVDFTPASVGTKGASLRVTDDAAGSPHTLPLSGTGTAPSLVLSGTSLTFAPQAVGTQSSAQVVSIGNSGTTTLGIGGVSVEGGGASDFHASGCAGASIAPGSSCAVNVRFAPTSGGARDASLAIVDDSGSKHAVSLHGTGSVATGGQQTAAAAAPAAQAQQPQAAAVAAAKPALLAAKGSVRVTRLGKMVVVRESISLGAGATVDAGVLRGGKRLTLLKGSRIGSTRINARARTITTRVAKAGVVTIELRLAKTDLRKGQLGRIVVHARSGSNAAVTLTTGFRR
jgi:hypothetical protein